MRFKVPAAGAWDGFGVGSASLPSLLYEHCVVLQCPCLSWLGTRLARTWECLPACPPGCSFGASFRKGLNKLIFSILDDVNQQVGQYRNPP